MFTQHIPRTGKPVGNITHTPAVRFGAALGTIALVSGFTLIAPAAASANEVDGASYAHAEFISGTILGTDLSNIAGLGAVVASNDGTQSRQVDRDPLTVSALGSTLINVQGGIQLPLLDIVDIGVVNQYAQADKNGESFAATGAIQNDGAIGVSNVSSGPAGDLTVDIDSLLSNEFASVLTDLKVELDGVSARANGSTTSATGDYTLADATLSFSSPAIGNLTTKVTDALGGINGQLVALGTDNGLLGNSIDSILDPLLSGIGSSADVTVAIDADVQGAVSSLLTGDFSSGGVSFNLQTGAVTVDLETLLGSDLNDLSPNTELLTDAVINQILNAITGTVATLGDDIAERVELALRNAHVEVTADLDLLTAQAPVETTVCNLVQVPILGGLLGDIVGYTTENVCGLVQTLLPDLRSTVDVRIVGSVDGLIKGTATESRANISLLGSTVNVALDVNTLIGSLGASLDNVLFSNGGVLSSVVNKLNSGLVNPAITGLLGDSSVATVLHSVLSVKVNVQERWTSTGAVKGDMFNEIAVRIKVLGGNATTLNFAKATVGPNVRSVLDPECTENCGPVVDPDCTENCGQVDPNCTQNCTTVDPDCTENCGTVDPTCTENCSNSDPCVGICIPGNPQLTELPTLPLDGQLAYTGGGVASLIALIVALLAAGAYFARQGYLRTHPTSEL